jgi:hypothetical protein
MCARATYIRVLRVTVDQRSSRTAVAVPPGTPVKTIRDGDVLDLTESAKLEAKRQYSKEVEAMFDAVMTDDPSEVDAYALR